MSISIVRLTNDFTLAEYMLLFSHTNKLQLSEFGYGK